MKRQLRAFTLIELLVVIAIIAILAAILFPVFAQAKVAAKAVASISNVKQTATATMIYGTDFDDMPPISENNDPGSPLLLNGQPYSPWTIALVPYIKAAVIFQDPLYRAEPSQAGIPDGILWAYRTQFGYNYATWSPVTISGSSWNRQTTPLSSIGAPSETVLFTAKKARNNTGDWLWTLGGVPAIWMANLVAPVYCNNATNQTDQQPQSYCAPAVRWGANGYYQGTAPPSYEEGLTTGGVAIRKMGQTIVTMGDTSTRAMTPSRLAAGTNWNRNIAYTSIVINNLERYMWDAK